MTFARTAISEGKRLWPFTVGFGITFLIVFKHALSLKHIFLLECIGFFKGETAEDAMKSPYINPDAPRKAQ